VSDSLLRHRLLSLLDSAGAVALEHYARGGEIRHKADASPVTDADLAAERIIVDGLREGWPDDTIWSEECGRIEGSNDAIWYVDPIDGTSAYTEGLAHWGPTIARVRSENGAPPRVEVGVIWLPRIREHYHVEGGRGWMNEEELPPFAEVEPAEVVYLPSRFQRWATLDWPCKGRNVGGTAAHLALVARGAAQAVLVPPQWSLWDTAAGLALIEALGGRALRVTDGQPLDPFRDVGVPFVAGFPGVVEELVRPGRIQTLVPGAFHARP